jgi:two-component system, sensor histidine kinase
VWVLLDRLGGLSANADDAERWRGRFITALTSLGSFGSMAIGIAYLASGALKEAVTGPLGVLFCVGLQALWRKTQSTALIAHVFGAFSSVIYFAGFLVHHDVSMLAWLAVVPLMVLFMGGRTLGAWWMALDATLMLGGMVYLKVSSGALASADGGPAAFARIAALMVMVFAVGLVFELSATSVLQRLKEATQARARFLANVSHELRTPLNGVLGMAELIAQGELSPDQRERLAVVLQSGNVLRMLIDDVLDATQLDHGTLRIADGPVVPLNVAQTVVQQLTTLAASKGLSLTLHRGGNEPLLTDGLRLMQVMSNLVSNALKYTQTGGVTLQVDSTRRDHQTQLTVVVTDTGPGLTKDQLASLFKPFVRLERDAGVQGTGLGLSIVKTIAELLGGQISATSEPGVGSSFCFTLVRPRAEVALILSAPSPRLAARVLLVDDNSVNLKVAKGLLEKLGSVVTTAGNGEEAVAQFKAGGFELVLMDLHMPVMDGFEAAQRIRSLDDKVTIVALSATNVKEELEAIGEHGIDAAMSKPVQLEQLRDMLQRRRSP